MKHNILSIAALAVLTLVAGCQQPEDLVPSVSRNGINSFVASFPDDDLDENCFEAEIDYDALTITVVVPWTYPANSSSHLEMADLDDMRVEANLDNNVTVEPALLFMDLTKDNYIVVTDQCKVKKTYTVRAEIRKSAECAITSFTLPSYGLSGVINEGTKVISIVAGSGFAPCYAEASLSFGATIDPDPSTTILDYSQPQSFTVTAQNGTTQAVYTTDVSLPEKVDNGMRDGSGKLLWQKKLHEDLGITTQLDTRAIAATENYIYILTKDQGMIYVSAKTGEKVGDISYTGDLATSLMAFNITADDNNNILLNNLAPNAGNFRIWKFRDPEDDPQLILDYANPDGLALGRKVSINGSLDGNAVITAPVHDYSISRMARWQICNGEFVSTEPEIVNLSGVGVLKNFSDVVSTSATNASADYIVAAYTTPYAVCLMDGTSNAIKAQSADISTNWVPQSVDYKMFNGTPYVTYMTVNGFTWGSDDIVYLYDFTASDFSALLWQCDKGTYGSFVNTGVANGNWNGDVALKVSDSGYFMYLYFMFSDGYVVCMQYDCLKM